ncbi:WXG100 family type VII secretion target [Corynebacterium lipophiloflavum]|uniref:ESAT-6-like protein n=1 Tax=Corynebacterium lipophiloflavum (strain ATCC 700352 / DSM 44291 / CCUG 37336 / JCM 10383 / DMMZ 1944) TaxID=525263 RepID=C0XUS5_CORLD|nr:WXG100 family type VII secretion target [Corynebacterium lipophiloflavum]EEI15991.1 WXG100 family type VII secretion target [Corynebacterium lipophiloflavum DSM 44291]
MTIKYEFGQLAGAAEDLRGSVAHINRMLDELKSGLQPMVSTWTGDAAEAYKVHQSEWDSAASDLNAILNSVAEAVDGGNSRMQQVNNAAAQSWG